MSATTYQRDHALDSVIWGGAEAYSNSSGNPAQSPYSPNILTWGPTGIFFTFEEPHQQEVIDFSSDDTSITSSGMTSQQVVFNGPSSLLTNRFYIRREIAPKW